MQLEIILPKSFTGPGLVDLQVNGFAGFDFNSDPAGWTPEDFHHVRERLLRRGVLVALPTFITDAPERMLARVRRWRELIAADAQLAAAFPAVHVEGPFISPETGPRGAHPLEHCATPETLPHFAGELLEAAEGRVAIFTLAPELPGALALIEQLAAHGVAVAIGHTNATPEDIEAAVCAGARLSTHLGNGSHQMLPRMANYIQAQLAQDDLFASFIADGHHVPPYALKNFLRAKATARSFLVSDAMAAADMGPGAYELSGMHVEVRQDLRTTLAGHEGLAGSALSLDRAVIYAAQHAGVSFETAWRMASAGPAAFIGLETETITVAVSPEGFALAPNSADQET